MKTFQLPKTATLSAALICFAAVAAAVAADVKAPVAASGAAPATNASTVPSLTDAEIAKIMMTANKAEIDAAEIAKKKASNAEVKSFAAHMIEEHTANSKEGTQIAKAGSIKPQENARSKEIESDAKAKTAGLKKLSGTAFDAGYMSQQISMHQSLLNDLNDKFIPAATNADFKAFLEKTKSHVADHLAMAKKVNEKLPVAKN